MITPRKLEIPEKLREDYRPVVLKPAVTAFNVLVFILLCVYAGADKITGHLRSFYTCFN